MITKTRTKNSDLKELLGIENIPKSSDFNKQKLIQLAKVVGQSRPLYKTKLGSALSAYTCESSVVYDPIFTRIIKKLRPDWFIKSADLNKQKLIKLAKSGKDRPKNRTKEAGCLTSYTTLSSGCYDADFTKKIKKLRPDWFINLTEKNKQKLIEIARKKLDKPKTTSKLGLALSHYTRKKSKTYDPVFTKKIKKLRPDWLVSSVIKNKQDLIRMAKNGEDRPKIKTRLGVLFRIYTRLYSKSFDQSFYNQIKAIAPDWINTSPEYKKQEIIKIAESGKKKPTPDTKLGRALRRYQFDPYYCDAKFISKVKKIRPEWFKK